MEGRAIDYRMNANSDNIPAGCTWFREGNYQDYFALPIYHQGEFKGAMAWSTRSNEGWSKEHIQIFEQSLAALSTVLRLHTNDIVLETLVGRLEEEVHKQTQELAATNASLEKANERSVLQSQAQLKNFAIMSHEIRTPLNCIVGISDLLLNSSLDPSMKESIEMITSSSDLLLAVVDDVLDYSKLATGNVEAIIRATNLGTIVNTVASSVQTKASLSGIQLRTNVSKELPDIIQTDGRRLQQILYNLLGNAIKFGKSGEFIDFQIDMLHDAETKRNFVQFTVKDYGNGLSTQDQKCIFEPFQQAASNEGLHGGTGLGLTITSKLVRVLGGTISVESEYGNWCEFRVCLPLSTDSEFGSMEIDSNNEESTLTIPLALPDSFAHLKVLIAEDNIVNQKVLRRTLENIGFKIIDIVDNGDKAVKASASTDYDIIFMDLQMPVMDGFAATRIISDRRRNSDDSTIPFIAILTAHAIEDFQQEAEEAGGDGFITKPFKVDTIKDFLRRFHMHRTESNHT
jgi:signal transduction histidine kinase/ActR/RegA family two-component response regulator